MASLPVFRGVCFDFSSPLFSYQENSQHRENKFITQNTLVLVTIDIPEHCLAGLVDALSFFKGELLLYHK